MPMRQNQQHFSIELGDGYFCDVDVDVNPLPPQPQPPPLTVASDTEVQGPRPSYIARTAFVLGNPCEDGPRPQFLDFVFSVRKA